MGIPLLGTFSNLHFVVFFRIVFHVNIWLSVLQDLVLLSVKSRIWQRVQNMCTPFYCLPLETWPGCKVQENRDLPDMLQAEKCLPGLPARSWVWSTSSGPGYSTRYQFERCNSKEWCQSWIFCRRAWSKGMLCFFIIETWMLGSKYCIS